MNVPVNEILVGDALQRLKELPDGCVHCCVTSPPYWGLRDYNVEGQLGLEATPEEYVENMVAVFRDVWRVLRPAGTLWLNMGDCYATGAGSARTPGGACFGKANEVVDSGAFPMSQPNRMPLQGLKPKDLVGLPWRLAFGLQADGWYLRSDIIWSKPNPMPESVTDRPTKAHEYVFLLAKSERYFFDSQAVRETAEIGNHHRNVTEPLKYGAIPAPNQRPHKGLWKTADASAGRNVRSVWTIATQPYREAHFATFPENLAARCIMAGTSEQGCCAECGAPLERIVEVQYENPGNRKTNGPRSAERKRKEFGTEGFDVRLERRSTTKGWERTCDHAEAAIVPCIVLDPFIGAGTTAVVALQARRHFLGIELNPQYATMARQRIAPELAQGRLA